MFGACIILYLSAYLYPAGSPAIEKSTGVQQTKNDQKDERTFTVLRLLEQHVDEVKFEDSPLDEVLKWFRDQGLKNMIIRWAPIELSGNINRNMPINLQLSDITLGDLLDYVLAEASQSVQTRDESITYIVESGVITFSTRADMKDDMFIRLYNISSIVHPVPGRDSPGSIQSCSSHASVNNVEIPQIAGNSPREKKIQQLYETLLSIESDTWEIYGGKGWIQRQGDRFMIYQCVEVHEIIGGTVRRGGSETWGE
ncbi:MAG: hypothetical protein HJJLKODD_00230 [Phycisphaerae bacterium]|nr:hypothetical protein [Phycisphaerae bacterium]